MKLYILRHGETVWNTEGRLQGMADIELNENGIRLAQITGEKLKDVAFDLAIPAPEAGGADRPPGAGGKRDSRTDGCQN